MSPASETASPAKTVAIIGGGLAGLAAACALADAGFLVTLFERKPYLGGRASSYEHPGTGETVDNCQHVLLGCCTNLLNLYQRIGAEDKIRWFDRLTFLQPGGGVSVIGATILPEPFHTAPSFLAATMLAWDDKLSIMRALLAMVRRPLADDGHSFLQWLRRHRQTERAIERFWKVILVSALNEDLDRVSVTAAALVFRESFLKSARGGWMGVPRVPLTELYSQAGDYIRARGGEIVLRIPVEGIDPCVRCHPERASFASEGPRRADSRAPVSAANGSDERAKGAHPNFGAKEAEGEQGVTLTVNGQQLTFDYVISAVPFDVLARLLPENPLATPLRDELASFQTSPITGVHLWFDRQITALDHAVLLDRTIQWMFHKSRLLDRSGDALKGRGFSRSADGGSQPGALAPGDTGNGGRETGNESGSYIELVISASKSLLEKSRQEIIDLALRELAEFFPAVQEAKLLKATVIKEVHATYSPVPGADEHRPTPATAWPRLFLAGDWTATGWPATMESAVRSGYLAAEALTRAVARPARFLVSDLPPSGFMRLFGK